MALGVVAILTGCSTAPREAAAPPPPPITCQAGADCEAKWSRAIAWVASNSQWKIQTQSNLLIQTYNSVDYSAAAGFTITKVATGTPGIYQINFDGGCANIIGCVPTVAESRASFAAFVNSGGAAPAVAPVAAPGPTSMVWARKDHRRVSGNAALEQQMTADRGKCNAEASAKGVSGDPAFEAAYKACMDKDGYVMLPLAEAQRLAR